MLPQPKAYSFSKGILVLSQREIDARDRQSCDYNAAGILWTVSPGECSTVLRHPLRLTCYLCNRFAARQIFSPTPESGFDLVNSSTINSTYTVKDFQLSRP